MPKGLELNIALGSPGGLDSQNSSALILHYFWVYGCLGAHSEDMVQQRGLSRECAQHNVQVQKAKSCILGILSSWRSKGWGSVATCRLLLWSSRRGEEVMCTHAASRRCVHWREWWKGQDTKGLKYKLVNADTYRSHSEPLLNRTQNPDCPLPKTYNVK